jgi:tetratricopeptide (TPR) repeat protein
MSGEVQVETVLAEATRAIQAGDAAAFRGAYARTRGIADEHRVYQAVFHLCELALTAGEQLAGTEWIELYAAAAGGVLSHLDREPSEPVLLNVAGVLLHELTEHEAAIALFERALELDASLPSARDNLAAATAAAESGRRLNLPGLAALGERGFDVASRARRADGLSISLCMIVKDEEELLPGCLEAARDAVDEMVVVDTGSSDSTVEIAESFGAKVVEFPWNGSFADARNVSLEHATGDWVIYIDADEYLAAGAAAALRDLLGRTWREGFYLRETNLTGDGSTGSAVRHPALRVFRNRPAYRFEGRIHEQKTRAMPTYLPERFEVTEIELLHYGYLKERVDARGKSRRNLELLEQQAVEEPSPFMSFNLGSEYQMIGEWARASAYFDDAWEGLRRESSWQDIGFAPLLAARAARARRECGRLEGACTLLAEAIVLLPDYTDLYFELAVCKVARGERREAELLLRRCLELGDAPARYAANVGVGTYLAQALLAEVRAALGDPVEAEALYRAALACEPGLTAAVLPLARLLGARGCGVSELRELVPDSALTLAAVGFLEAERPVEAEALLRERLAAEPADASARVALLQALLAQERYAEAAAAAARDLDDPVAGPLAAEVHAMAVARAA